MFDVQDDANFGFKFHSELVVNPEEYPLVDETEYPDAYGHLNRIQDQILESDDITYLDEFEWQVHLIDDDETQQSFSFPGGYTYVYTGLIKSVENEDQLAAAIAHEMAHADLRHGSQQLSDKFSTSIALSVVIPIGTNKIHNMMVDAIGMKFAREDETEADETSVNYLCDTSYAADAPSTLLTYLDAEEGSSSVELFSSHPSDANRISDIDAFVSESGCSTTLSDSEERDDLLGSLP